MGIMSTIFGEGGASENAKALEAVQSVPLPILKEFYPELYQQVVSLNPEIETAVNLGPSEMQGVATDPSLRQAQMRALQKLQEIGDAGGRDSQFMADSNALQTEINTNTRGQQDAIMQNLATRGMAGGGSELVARNMAVQNGANRQSQMGMDLKAQAERRALDAIMNSGTLGGQMDAQEFSQQSQKAAAADAIAKFNTQNQQQVMRNNVNTKNDAQQWNATNAQTVSNQNTGVNNEAKQYNLNIAQRNFDNAMGKATGVANQYGNIATSKDKERDGDMRLIGGAINAGATAYGGGK